ncbi:glycine betaine ABC transporter substrate-binding protein, partial [Enterococcus innesii]|uniref:glycine betaine ABC transporter substrate-binding protein n=1 Tax=Enterococcus innesii TaxID=2839759 RepID=UPI003F87B2FB
QGAPLMKEAFAKEHPEVVRALEKLAGKITEEQMSEMNYQVNVEGKNPAEVASTFLIDEGLIEEGKE